MSLGLSDSLEGVANEQLQSLTEATSHEATIQMINLFLKNTPPKIDHLMQAFNQNDFDQISKISHQLKSSCGYLGLQALENDFCTLEMEAKKNSADQLLTVKSMIPTHLEQYTEFLINYLNHFDQRSTK